MLRTIDSVSYGSRFRKYSPVWKCGFAVALLLLAYVTHPWVQAILWGWLVVWTVGYAAVPWKLYAVLSGSVFLFYLVSLPPLLLELGSPGDHGIVLLVRDTWSVYMTPEHIQRALQLGVRIGACTACFMFLILTTPFADLLGVMARMKLPAIVTELMLIMYRFLFFLSDTASGLMRSRRLRGGKGGARAMIGDASAMAGQLFMKTMVRYRGLEQGLAVRGYDGTLPLHLTATERMPARYRMEGWAGVVILAVLELWCVLSLVP